jgi:hypothetical protein
MNLTKVVVLIEVMVDEAMSCGQSRRVPFSYPEDAMVWSVNMFLRSIGKDPSPIGIGRDIFNDLVRTGEKNEIIKASGGARLLHNRRVGIFEKRFDNSED